MRSTPRTRRSIVPLILLVLATTVGAAVATGTASVSRTIPTGAVTTYQVVRGTGTQVVALHGTDASLRNAVSVFTSASDAAATLTEPGVVSGAEYGSAAGNRIYVANQDPIGGSYRIGVLDAASGAPLGTVTVPTDSVPKFVETTADGATAVTFNDGDGSTAPIVSVMAIPAGTAAGTNHTITGSGGWPMTARDLSPDNRFAYLAFDTPGPVTVQRIDLASGAVTAVDVGLSTTHPMGIGLSPDGSHLAVVDDAGTLTLHTLASGANVTVPGLVANSAAGPVFSSDGATVYAISNTNRLVIINTATATTRATLDYSSRGGLNCTDASSCLQLTADGRQLLFPIDASATTSDLISVLDTRTEALSYLTVGQNPKYVWPSTNTADAYVTYGNNGGTVTLLRTASAPSAPTGVAITAGRSAARVTWTAPSDDGGSTITRYTATAQPGDHSCTWTTGALACEITGLTGGTAYAVTVTATNLAGTSVASSAASVTPTGGPGVPTAVKATAGLLRATVTWKAPADTGGGITGYTATASPGGATCTTTGALTCTITGLLNTKAYTVTVTARSAGGTSAASAKSASVRPYKKLGMRKPTATSSAIRSQVKTSGPGTITQITTNTKNATVCRTTAKPKKQGTTTLTCSPNKATRTALKKKAQTLSILTTLLTKQGASFAATHRVTLPKSG